MIDSNMIVSHPVHLTDIWRALGYSNSDITENGIELDKLCIDPRINMWSKIKPLIFDSPHIEISEGDTWKQVGTNHQCGIEVTPVSSGGDLINAVTYDRSSFKYLRLQDSDWHRILDFDGYSHYALNPFGSDFQCPKQVIVGQRFQVYMKNTQQALNRTDGVQIRDLAWNASKFEDMFFGCVFSGSFACIHTNDLKLCDVVDGQQIVRAWMDIDTTGTTGGIPSGSYTIFPTISLDQRLGYTSSDIAMQGTLFSIPGWKPADLRVYEDGYINEGETIVGIVPDTANSQVSFKVVGTTAVNSMEFRGSVWLIDDLGNSGNPVDVVFEVRGGTIEKPVNGTSETIRLSAFNNKTINQNWRVGYRFNNERDTWRFTGEFRIV